MLTTLNTSYTDTCAADLAWTLGASHFPHRPRSTSNWPGPSSS
ncbi:hypothetical protein SALBM311S_04386 [Streptomyces alboniger]